MRPSRGVILELPAVDRACRWAGDNALHRHVEVAYLVVATRGRAELDIVVVGVPVEFQLTGRGGRGGIAAGLQDLDAPPDQVLVAPIVARKEGGLGDLRPWVGRQ